MAAVSSSTSSVAVARGGGNTTHLPPRSSKPSTLSFNPNPTNPTAAAVSASFRRQHSPAPIRYSASSSDHAAALPDRNPSPLKSRLAAGDTLYGLFLLSNSPTLAEISGLAGYDYVVVDMEHGPGGISDALPCLQALAAARTPAILRLPESSPAWAKKALDLGPQGLMFPSIETPRDAELAVSYCRFPPRGVRGAAHTVVRASAYGIDDGYLERCEEEILIMCQAESAAAVEEIEAIAAVEGVGCVQMGPMDLSASMGYLWDPGHRKVKAVLREAERRVLAVKEASASAAVGGGNGGPYLGGFAMPHDSPEELRKRGYHMVAGAVDLGMFRRAAVEDVMRFRRAATKVVAGEESGGEKADDESYWSE